MSSKFVQSANQTTLFEQGLRGGRYDPEIFKEAKWRPTPLSALPTWRGAKRIGFDFETKDEDLSALGPGVRRDGSYAIGFSYCIEDPGTGPWAWPKHYVPFRHGHPDISGSYDDNVEGDAVGWLMEQFKGFDGEVVGANLPYDVDWGTELGCDMSKVSRFLDVQVADPLLYELEDYYSLDEIAKRRLGEGKDETLLRRAAADYHLDPKAQMWMLPARYAGPYAEVDALRPLQIMRLQEEQIDAEGISECWDMECQLLPILVRMCRKGVRVDVDRLDQVEEWTRRQEKASLDVVARETGVPIPVGETMNAELLGRALKAAGLADLIGQTATGKESVTKDAFAGVDHPVAKALARARQVSTVRTTFVGGVRRHLVDGRIHCTFNQIRKTDDTTGDSSGVKYGRLSASHPNMQNQPGNSRFTGDNELGPMWRSIYLAEEGEEWTSLDLKQQEPKWSFHYGAILEERGVEGVRGALTICEALRANPQLDTYEPIVDLAGVPRSKAKVIWLARAYGKGDGGLCEDLGLPTREVTFSRKIYYDRINDGMDKYAAKFLATVPVDSPEGEAALAGGRGMTWKGAGPEGRALIQKFDDGMSFLKVAAGLAKDVANQRGYVKLLSGRRCHFRKASGGKGGYEWTNKAFNRIIQGTSSEQTKRIMIAVDEAGYGDRLMLQVHDEIAISGLGREMAMTVADVMRTAVPMKIPTVVDVERGPSWGESMEVEYQDKVGKKAKTRYVWGMSIVDGEPVYRGSVL